MHWMPSPGAMGDSMISSMASVTSLARDPSWDNIHTDTERWGETTATLALSMSSWLRPREITMTEDSVCGGREEHLEVSGGARRRSVSFGRHNKDGIIG